ncbi:MAG TPA: D-alanyl-D-alanine carboxypeptidase family protein, partial [Chthoniobacteraceae bacterium]|nr:D-alanyl-D-alanine carboxypeptidase family protein [Chthoniobacteraceae bacterium]
MRVNFRAFCILLPAFALFAHAAVAADPVIRRALPVEDDEEPNSLPAYTYSATPPQVKAESVMVIDAKSGKVLYEKNADEKRPPASTQKLLTALILAGDGDLDKSVTAEASDTWAEPVVLGLKPGDTYTRRELLTVMLVHSTNDVARFLARDNAGSIEEFATKMNRKAAELGMTNSHFVNPNGLPASGQYSTARDMAKLAMAAYANRTIRGIVSTKVLEFQYANGRETEFKNTNRVLRSCSFCNGMKTGYTEAAGRCLVA